jgi:hypothetical protein
MKTFDRYAQFRDGSNISIVPFGEIPVKKTDIKIIFKKDKMRLDQLSHQYYDNSDYGWLILQANPQYGSLEFDIPDGVELRIPYPLDISINDYKESINKYNKYYK